MYIDLQSAFFQSELKTQNMVILSLCLKLFVVSHPLTIKSKALPNKRRRKKGVRPLANSQEETEALYWTTREELNHTNKHVNLEVKPSPVKPTNETPALGGTLISALPEAHLSHTQIPT